MPAPDGTLDEGTISIQLVTNQGAATVTDTDNSSIVYKLHKKPIEAKVLKSTGEVLTKDGLALELTPNTLITPANTQYRVSYEFRSWKWIENWYLDNRNYLIGEIVPTNINPSFTTLQTTLIDSLSIIDNKLFLADVVRGKVLSVNERREVFTIVGTAQPQQFAYYHGLVSSNSGLYIGRKETLIGVEISAASIHTAQYSIRLQSDYDNNFAGPWTITNAKEFINYTINEDFQPTTQLCLFYVPDLGKEVNNCKVTLIFKERI